MTADTVHFQLYKMVIIIIYQLLEVSGDSQFQENFENILVTMIHDYAWLVNLKKLAFSHLSYYFRVLSA